MLREKKVLFLLLVLILIMEVDIVQGNWCNGADLNHDKIVDALDLAIVRTNFGCSGVCEGDINSDNIVDANDLAAIRKEFGNTNCEEIIEISSCGILNQANAIYLLKNNVETNRTCFTITADGITLDGRGFNLDGDDGGGDYGVNITGRSNITLKSLNITNFGRGISLDSTNNSLLLNNRLFSNSGAGIRLFRSSFNVAENNTIILSHSDGIESIINSNNNNFTRNIINSGSYDGIMISNSNSNRLINNSFNSNGESAIILFANAINNYIANNTFSSNSNKLSGSTIRILSSSSNNTILGNIIYSGETEGIYISSSNGNMIWGGLINRTNRDAIKIVGIISSNTNIKNVSIKNTNLSYYDLKWDTTGINNNYLTDMLHIGNYSFTGAGGTIIVKNNNFGEIKFLQAVNGSGTNLTNDIKILRNMAFIDAKPGLNKQARISLYGNVGQGLSNPIILNNGFECNSATIPGCIAITDLTEETVIFDVSGAGNYSIGESISFNRRTRRFEDYKNNLKALT